MTAALPARERARVLSRRSRELAGRLGHAHTFQAVGFIAPPPVGAIANPCNLIGKQISHELTIDCGLAALVAAVELEALIDVVILEVTSTAPTRPSVALDHFQPPAGEQLAKATDLRFVGDRVDPVEIGHPLMEHDVTTFKTIHSSCRSSRDVGGSRGRS
jgi:hypothetical protein